MRLLLDRKEYDAESTVGDLYVDGVWECVVMEPGVGEDSHPAIPEGEYEVLLTHSPAFNRVLPLITDVPGRDGIRIHPGNQREQTLGCLMTGETVQFISGVPFLMHSKASFDRLYNKLRSAAAKAEKLTLEVIA